MSVEGSYAKSVAAVLAITTIVAVALSTLWRVPYIYTFVGAATLVVIGHVITIDDDLPGGFGDPDGSQPFPWRDLTIKVVIAILLGLAALVPEIAAFGYSTSGITVESAVGSQAAKISAPESCLQEGAKLVGARPIVIAIDKGVKPPKKVRDVKPSYPHLPAGTVGSGMWIGELLVGFDGKVAHVWTLRDVRFTPPFPAFNAAIVAAIQQWEFEPVVVESKPTPICITATMTIDWQ